MLKNMRDRNVSKLKNLKCLVIDEADFFFTDENVIRDMDSLKNEILNKLT